MTNLPIGSYTSSVNNRPALGGEMIISGTNTNPAISYEGVSATGVSWDANAATITFSFQGWTFNGSYNATAGTFSGNADNGRSIEGTKEGWTAQSEDEETSARQANA